MLPLTDTTNEAHSADKEAEGTTTTDPAKDSKPRAPRERKQRGPPEDGVPSKTKVMVANLPYDLSEDKVSTTLRRYFCTELLTHTLQLKELFTEYSPSSAKIALRPIPRFMVKKLQARNEPRKGRGFGFVTLGSEEMQQKAVKEMNGKDVEGREIAVKVAIDSPGKEDVDEDAAGGEQLKENGVTVADNAPATAAT